MPRTSVKSPDAFRTISEAADALDLPQHVLRFWETRFSQIKPMKRSGGRRYYRPTDIALLQGIRHLLYDEGYTIKGVQRILREQGIAHVSAMGTAKSMPAPTPEPPAPTLPNPAKVRTPADQAPVVSSQSPDALQPVSATPPAPAANAVHAGSAGQAAPQPVQPQSKPLAVAPAQPNPNAASNRNAETSLPIAQLPVHQVPDPRPVPDAASSQHQPQTHSNSAEPLAAVTPQGPLASAPGSTLRFMPEIETQSEPPFPVLTPTEPAPLPPLAHASAVPTSAHSATPTASVGLPVDDVSSRLSAQDTEALVQALRTLLDCKAILDSARQPTPKPTGS